ncbi:MAG: hypothetical protein CMH50_00850 [Myxococcales bacterium]|nr:hypothetical protein [Myxococcales bacterium]
MTDAVLELKDLAIGYEGEAVAHGLSLQLNAGEMVSVVGSSGVGKSSLLRAIAGFLRPLEGQILLTGEVVNAWSPQRRRVGMVFQDFALFSHMSVADNVGFGVKGQPEAVGRVQALLERFDLADFGQRLPAQLSGGQQQRVGLARALAPRPKLILLDEPFANLDTDLRQELGVWFRDQIQSEGTAALMVTHDRAEAHRLSDRVLELVTPGQGRPATWG